MGDRLTVEGIEERLRGCSSAVVVLAEIAGGRGPKATWSGEDEVEPYMQVLLQLRPSVVYVHKSRMESDELEDTLAELEGVAGSEARRVADACRRLGGVEFHELRLVYLHEGVQHILDYYIDWYEAVMAVLAQETAYPAVSLVPPSAVDELVANDAFVLANVKARERMAKILFRDRMGTSVNDGLTIYHALELAHEQADEVLRSTVRRLAEQGAKKSEIQARLGISGSRVNRLLTEPAELDRG